MLDWYDAGGRDLPWRVKGGARPDPYRVWLSEIMLQQTTVAAVGPYFARFLERWPGVAALAAADLDEVLAEWAGLGYYARARNLHKCAVHVANELAGRFPESLEGLLALPGVGPYTAAAIAAIAFDIPANVVDGNVERVMARLHAVETPLPGAKKELTGLAGALVPQLRAGDYAQSLMDLGATVCTPRNPRCDLCPVAGRCRARALGLAADLPRRRKKAAKPTRHGVAFLAVREDGAVLLRRRPEKGLLGGMMEVPSTPWREAAWRGDEALSHGPLPSADWAAVPGMVRHTFTHFHLELEVRRAAFAMEATLKNEGVEGRWVAPADLDMLALPTVMKKVCRLALETGR